RLLGGADFARNTSALRSPATVARLNRIRSPPVSPGRSIRQPTAPFWRLAGILAAANVAFDLGRIVTETILSPAQPGSRSAKRFWFSMQLRVVFKISGSQRRNQIYQRHLCTRYARGV